mgnify:CR=1 FL=1
MAIILIAVFLIPEIPLVWLLWRNKEHLYLPSMRKKIGALYVGVNLDDERRYDFVVFLGRRKLFILLTLFVGHPSFIVHFFIFSTVWYVIYVGHVMPLEEKSDRYLQLVNESLLIIACYPIVLFVNPELERITKDNYGSLFIAIISILIGCNLTFAIVKSILNCKKAWRKKKLDKLRVQVLEIKKNRALLR